MIGPPIYAMPSYFLIPILTAALLALVITPIVIKIANRLKLVDDPRTRFHPARTHSGIVPRAGGLALCSTITISLVIFIPLTKLTLALISSLALLTFVGILDDRRDIDPYLRLVSNTIAALIIIGIGIGIPFITNPLTGGIIPLDTLKFSFNLLGPHSLIILADTFALIWILWTMNIIGWSAGVDGQMPGFVVISAFVLGLLSLRYAGTASQEQVTILAGITTGAFLGFLPWNFYPQKIMPGYSGKTIAGFLLAILGILSYGKLGTALLVLGIPMIDAIYTISRRIMSGHSPVWADRGHLHHLLLDLGWGKRRIALFYWGVSAILGAIALTVTSKQKLFAFLLLFVGVSGLLLWLRFFSRYSRSPDPDNG